MELECRISPYPINEQMYFNLNSFEIPEPIVLDVKARAFKAGKSPCFSYPRLARAFKSSGYTSGRLKHKLRSVVDEEASAFVKTSKT
jgi:hypothetical protein